MYDKIASIMNRDFGASDLGADDVEQYLRYGSSPFVTADEEVQIDALLEKFL